MIRKLRNIKRKLLGRTSEELLNSLRFGGAIIGNKVVVFDPAHTIIDETRPWLLKIGSYA